MATRKYQMRVAFCALVGAGVLCQLCIGLYLHLRSRPKLSPYEECGCRNFALTSAALFNEDCVDDFCRTTCRRGFPWATQLCTDPQRRLFADLVERQHPTNCNERVLVDTPANSSTDFSATVHYWGHRLMQAVDSNRTLIASAAARWRAPDHTRCPRGDLYCYFQPWTSCKDPAVVANSALPSELAGNGAVVAFDATVPLFPEGYTLEVRANGPPRYRPASADVYARLGVQRWVFSNIVSFIARPNDVVMQAVAARIEETRFRSPNEFTVALLIPGAVGPDNKRLYPFLEFAKAVLDYLDRRFHNERRIMLTAFLVTDDPSIVKEADVFRPMFSRWIFSTPEDFELQNVRLVADVFLAASADWVIGVQASDLHRLVFELARAWHPKRHANDIGCLFQLDPAGRLTNCVSYEIDETDSSLAGLGKPPIRELRAHFPASPAG
eukprot:TRINITY_DN10190_c0_g1_i1.p1 TRINITY_DN10190_c0_g1~~TRINITY_DN10190_c0_g1_i1.p1  ORF type:complete len:440 (-),score=74.20 TRINITY_DN10190_c0_g1_i1:154-1473(-)